MILWCAGRPLREFDAKCVKISRGPARRPLRARSAASGGCCWTYLLEYKCCRPGDFQARRPAQKKSSRAVLSPHNALKDDWLPDMQRPAQHRAEQFLSTDYPLL